MINIAEVDRQYLLFFSLATAKTITRDHCYTELILQTGKCCLPRRKTEKIHSKIQNVCLESI